ncbi:hypothetical protein RCL_jg16219.t2 [Rhizophagus clarus]|uniref:Uncharacterized protein n=1 Tax=Rhizophagus clarus TaxID=94130 RepID=A0A8H3M9X0_9GLOM|nr:hypothetical protein RCL_jg16219.t2 [Rhizophagus clarus]
MQIAREGAERTREPDVFEKRIPDAEHQIEKKIMFSPQGTKRDQDMEEEVDDEYNADQMIIDIKIFLG